MSRLGTTTQPHIKHTPSYYQFLDNLAYSQHVKNLDDKDNFNDVEKRAHNESSRNFFIDFGHDEAWCAFDLGAEAWSELLRRPRPEAFDTRWINIWAPNKQTDLVECLAKKYGFSPRLTGLMQSRPLKRHKHRNETDHSPNGSPLSQGSPVTVKGRGSSDVEKLQSSADVSHRSLDPLLELNHYDVVNSIWHWSSVDWGTKYLCIGFNALHDIKTAPSEDDDDSRENDLPNGVRIWNWLILGNDKTVITMTEDFQPKADVALYRRNLLNVLRQLSMSTEPFKSNAMTLVPIRYNIGDEDVRRQDAPTDGPGLLFYYLFDDWYETYRLLAKQENQYRVELNRLRKAMRRQAELSHVDRLQHIGRQLGTLLRLYRSYELIIDRIMEKQTPAPRNQTHPFSTPASSVQESSADLTTPPARRPSLALSMSNTNIASASPDQLGIFLTSSSRLRFERLRDRIRLYAISEIQECIELKESLVGMNFSLITIRESNSVERLTRITILLAKVTILFLPVSLMTAYFSVQIPEANFTVKAYWTAFAIVVVLSFILIWVFGKISGTVEGQMVWQPITQVMLDIGKGLIGRGRLAEKAKAG